MRRTLSLSLFALVATAQANYKYEAQDPMLDKEYYKPACPDYRTYAMYGQYVQHVTNSINAGAHIRLVHHSAKDL